MAIDDTLISKVREIVGAENCLESLSDRMTHSYDATQKVYLPDLVVYVERTRQVRDVVRIAARYKIPIVARGAGSGYTGGILPVQGGIVIALSRMNAILEIDEDNLLAIVQPGVITGDLQRAVEKKELFYPPDPASKDFSSIGGNIAECAGGPRCVKYGVTKDYVLGLEVVTPTGEVIRTGGKTLKNVVGYDLTKLFVGSEGTLGIVTEITLKLLPKPEAKKTMLVQFGTIEGAAQAVSTIIKAKIIPTTLEFLDKSTIDCIREGSPLPLPEGCAALLIIEVDGEKQLLEKQAEKILEVIRPLGVVATTVADTEEESEKIWQVRRSISPNLRKINPDKFNEDIVVPRAKVPDMIRKLEEISKKYDVPIVNFGHAGDGNIHVNAMVDLREENMAETMEDVMHEIFVAAVSLDGSLSGEHGIGTSKAKYFDLEIDAPTRACMVAIKKAMDPDNIMNPGRFSWMKKRVRNKRWLKIRIFMIINRK